MTETPLIRRQTTADRGVKAVTTHEVLACIKELTGETFSTRELANALMVRHENIVGGDGLNATIGCGLSANQRGIGHRACVLSMIVRRWIWSALHSSSQYKSSSPT